MNNVYETNDMCIYLGRNMVGRTKYSCFHQKSWFLEKLRKYKKFP